uniref:Mitochondrial dicarboxylate carrier (inferred by orthology to a human protein) n=1 Tax=Strongyloides venezuelensis TaxID=75913 RepID=A0A0K0FA73_STRVS
MFSIFILNNDIIGKTVDANNCKKNNCTAFLNVNRSSENKTLTKQNIRKNRFWFGGFASCVAGFATHPIELIKVHLQTQQVVKIGIIGAIVNVYKLDGMFGFYSGITGNLFRQATSAATRFTLYDLLKKKIDGEKDMHFWVKALCAAVSGAIGGFFGTPADKTCVRMMNDAKLPHKERRNYKHVFDSLYRMVKEEGFLSLLKGWELASTRASFLTVGQAAFYDQIKISLLETEFFHDNLLTFFVGSFIAAGVATLLTQPVDTIKIRIMNSEPGVFKGYLDCFLYTLKLGPLALYKGLIPAFIRIAPYTILIFIISEELRVNFGEVVE